MWRQLAGPTHPHSARLGTLAPLTPSALAETAWFRAVPLHIRLVDYAGRRLDAADFSLERFAISGDTFKAVATNVREGRVDVEVGDTGKNSPPIGSNVMASCSRKREALFDPLA